MDELRLTSLTDTQSTTTAALPTVTEGMHLLYYDLGNADYCRSDSHG
jgi:hypothetical protein